MIGRTVRGIVQLFGALGAALAVLVVLAAWRLSSGPISLAFLSPTIEEALSAEDGSFRVRLDDTILTWAGWERTLDVRVLNVRAEGPGGTAVAVVPELSLSLSAKALLKGVFAPRSIELYRPSLQVVRRRDGTFEVGFGRGETASDLLAGRLLQRLAAEPDGIGGTGYLARVAVRDADLLIIDRQLETSWHAPTADVSLHRDADGIGGEISLDLEIDRRLARVTLLGGYQRELHRIDFGVEFSEIVPASFAGLSPRLAPLAAVALPLRGTLLVSLQLDGGLEAVEFDVSGGVGHLDLPAPLGQTVDVIDLAAKGLYRGSDQVLEVDHLSASLGEAGSLLLPASDGHRVPLRALTARLDMTLGADRLRVVSLDADLGGPTASLSGEIVGEAGDIRVLAEGTLRDVSMDRTGLYWPAAWGRDPHAWVTKNLSDGRVVEARARLDATVRGGDAVVVINSLTGDMRLEGATVDYLSPLPKATGADGTATFSKHRFDIAISRGRAAGLTVSEGHLTFTGLDEKDQYLDVDLAIQGPVKRAIRLIDRKPLRLASKIGLDAETTSGEASTRLKLHFILEKDLTIEQVEVAAVSQMRNVSVANAILGRGISKANLDLTVDNQAMVVSGKVNVGTIPGTLEWRRNFDDKAPLRAEYVLRGTVTDRQRRDELGLDFPPFSEEFVSGPVAAELHWQIPAAGEERMRAKLDLTQTRLALPQLAWSKAAGLAASAEVEISLRGDRVTGVPRFAVAGQDLSARGAAVIDPATETLRRIDLAQLRVGRTDIRGAMVAGRDGGWTITVHGPGFDFAPIVGDFFSFASDLEEVDAEPGPALSLAVDLDRVWLDAEQSIGQVRGTMARQEGKWRAVTLSGVLAGGKTLTVRIEPGKGDTRDLTVLSNDAGATLRTFGYYENMLGGQFEIRGRFDDDVAGAPLSGRMTVGDFRIVRAPALAHVVSLLALTGIVDALQGPGLSFADLEMPFVRHEGVITLTDGRVHGSALGFTAEGKIYAHAEVVDIEGTLVPAYAINSVLGNLPFVGALFSGGDKGGGVFAATYKMTGPLEQPKVTVNPLSVLAPGFLRKLFGLFDGKDPPPPVPAPPAPKPLVPRP